MENTRLSNGKVALITIGCLIAKVVIWIVTGFTAILILAPFLGTEEPAPTTGTEITALQIRNQTIELTEGQSVDRYFQVTATGDFSGSDLKLISADTGIVIVEFKEISMTHYVYFTVTGVSEGTAEIYFETADGSIRSEKIAVAVRSNGANATDESNHSNSTTASTDTASSDTKTNVSTSTKPAASDTTDTPASTSTPSATQKPANTSTTPAASDTQTTSDNADTPQNSGNSSSGGNSVTVPNPGETGEELVWVPTISGKKYHVTPSCSGMENPRQVTKSTAIAEGYTPCQKRSCYG